LPVYSLVSSPQVLVLNILS